MKFLLHLTIASVLGLACNKSFALATWTNATPSIWTEGTNWDTTLPPNGPGNEEGRIDNGGTAINDDPQTDAWTGSTVEIRTGSLTLGSKTNASGTFLMNSTNTFFVKNTDTRIGGNPVVAIGGGVPAIGGTGVLSQTAGTIIQQGGNLNIGLRGANATELDPNVAYGTYNLSGADSAYIINFGFIVAIGNRAVGTFNQTGGRVEIRSLSSTGPTNSVIQLGRNALSGSTTTSGTWNFSGGSATAAFVRFGQANQTSGASTNTINLSGTAKLQTGTIEFLNTTVAVNTFNFTGGTLSSITNKIPTLNNGGTLSPYTIDFTTIVDDTTSATIYPIGTNYFTAANSYTQTVAGTLAIDIGGPGVNDLVDIGAGASVGNASLAGTIAVTLLNAYNPALGTTFDILTADSVISTATVTGSTPDGNRFQPSIVTGGDGRQVLRLTVVVPQPQITGVAVVGGSLQFSFTGITGSTYKVVTSTDVGAPLASWTVLGTATETPASSGQFQFTDPSPTSSTSKRFYRVLWP